MTKDEKQAIEITIRDLRVIMGILEYPTGRPFTGHLNKAAASLSECKVQVGTVLNNLEAYFEK